MHRRLLVIPFALATLATAGCGGGGDDSGGSSRTDGNSCPAGGNEGLFGGYKQGRGEGDAPVCAADDTGAVVINFPDGFPNVATKCAAPGIRIFVPRDTDQTDRPSVSAIADPGCTPAA